MKNLISFALDIFSPLARAKDDAYYRDQLFYNLGWDFTVISNFPITEVQNSINAFVSLYSNVLEDLDEPLTDFEGILSLLENVREYFEAVETMSTSIATSSSVNNDVKNEFSKIGKELFDYLLVSYLEIELPFWAGLLKLGQIVKREQVAAKYDTSNNLIRLSHETKVIDFGALRSIISNDLDFLKQHYYGGTSTTLSTVANATTFANKLFPIIGEVLTALNFQVYYGIDSNFQGSFSANEYTSGQKLLLAKFDDNNGNEFGFAINISSAVEGDLGIVIVPFGTYNFTGNIGPWAVDMSVNQLPTSLRYHQGKLIIPSGANGLKFELKATTESEYDLPYFFGLGDFFSLTSKSIGVVFAVSADQGGEGELAVTGLVDDICLEISKSDTDGFIGKVLPEKGISLKFSLGIGYSDKRGVFFQGGGGFNIDIPIHKTVFGIEFSTVTISAALLNGEIPVQISTSFNGKLGPIAFSVEKIGLRANIDFPSSGNGNLGKLNLNTSFKPPNGIGLQIDAKGITGGGYLYMEHEKGRYVGALELDIIDKIHVTAIGIITTKNPDGTPGFSMLLLISAEFPGVPLGFGFSLNGVGGLGGVNRTMNTEPMRLAIKDGGLERIMFPRNVVENIQTIVVDLESYFPIQQNRYTFGLFFLVKWGVGVPLVDIKIGLIISLPAPVKLAILGVIKVTLPTEAASVLKLNVAFIGVIDFEKKYLAFDASIYDSRLLFISLYGDMLVRLFWGERKEMLISVGGFHPAYQKGDYLMLPPQINRLTLSIIDTDFLRLVIDTYFAVTSNTVQLGVSLDFRLEIAGFRLIGWFGFDVLFQFNPFKFIAAVRAGLAVMLGKRELLCISAELTLQGPAPWHAVGRGEFKALGVKYKADFDRTWGDKPDTSLPTVDVKPKLETALTDIENWQTTTPGNRQPHVRFRTPPTNSLVFDPMGELTIAQKVLPFHIKIERFGGQKVNDSYEYVITEVKIADAVINYDKLVTSQVKENFAPAQFKDLSDEKKLEAEAFEYLASGVTVRWADENITTGDYLVKDLGYDLVVIDKEERSEGLLRCLATFEQSFVVGGAISANSLAQKQFDDLFSPFQSKVAIKQEAYRVVSKDSLIPLSAISAQGSLAEVVTEAQRYIRKNPSAVGTLELVPV